MVLSEWIVGDGELDRPRPGTVLGHVGLRASAVDVAGDAGRPEGGPAAAAEWPSPAGPVEEVRGLTGPARDFFVDAGQGRSRRVGAEFVLDAGAYRVLASTPLPAAEVREGEAVLFRCVLSVIADYEWQGFGLPDVRQEWTVLGVGHRGGDFLLDLEPGAPPGHGPAG